MGFCVPTAHEGSEVHCVRVCHTRYVPSSGFGYPHDGLLPPSPCRFCFTPAALLGFTLRSFLLPQGIRAFPRGRTHIPFFLPLLPPPKQRAGPAGRGSWALTLARVPGGTRGVSAATAGYSLGVHPSRVCGLKLWPGFRPASSHALCERFRGSARRRLRVSIGFNWVHPATAASRESRSGQPS
jgi:hypothetical protein